MAAVITELIDKQDGFEIIRDEIAAILALEIANQKALAIIAGKTNPDLWFFNTFVERSNPWELREDDDGQPVSEPPLINVFFDTAAINLSKTSQASQEHKYSGIFNIDCYGAKNTKEVSQGVHAASDELTARESQRVAKLARNILAFNEYKNLGIPTIVQEMSIRQFDSMQPNIQDRPSNKVMVTRISLAIEYTEDNLATIPDTLELVTNQCIRKSDGLIYFQADFDYT